MTWGKKKASISEASILSGTGKLKLLSAATIKLRDSNPFCNL
jgi:hypothetical protein